MSYRTKDVAKEELAELVAELAEPATNWRRVRVLVGQFVDALHEHMEDEFLEQEPQDD